MPYDLVLALGDGSWCLDDVHDRCPLFRESLSVPNNLVLLESWTVEAEALLPEKADLDQDHIGTSAYPPGYYKPGEFIGSAICGVIVWPVAAYFPMAVARGNTLVGGLLPASMVVPSKRRLARCPMSPSSF